MTAYHFDDLTLVLQPDVLVSIVKPEALPSELSRRCMDALATEPLRSGNRVLCPLLTCGSKPTYIVHLVRKSFLHPVCGELSISEQTFHRRWRRHGRLEAEELCRRRLEEGHRKFEQVEAALPLKTGGEQWLVRWIVEAGMGVHLVSRLTQFMQDPSAVAHGLSVTRRYRDGATFTTIGPPAHLSHPPAIPGHPASPPGDPAEEVLAMIGMTGKLEELVERRVIAFE